MVLVVSAGISVMLAAAPARAQTAPDGPLQAFNDVHERTVTGEVTLRLFKGSAVAVARSSPFGIYNHALSSYGAQDAFDHRASEGFIKLLGLPLHLFSSMHEGKRD